MSSTINLQLTNELRRFVDQRTSDDDVYSTPSEYLRDLIRRDMERQQKSLDMEIAEMLLAARNSPTTPYDPDFFKRERARLKKENAASKKTSK